MSTAPDVRAEQLWLFEETGIDIGSCRLAEEDLMGSLQAVNTRKAYAHSWAVFGEFCAGAGRDACPASPETVRLFVSWCLSHKRYRLETVRTHLSGIKSQHRRRRHPVPVDDSVRALLRAAARRLREKPAGKLALSPEQLRTICKAMAADGSPLAVRDRALLLWGFAGGFRRSELSGFELDDLHARDKGYAVDVWKTKTDQEAKGRVVGVPYGTNALTCPVRALNAWLGLRGHDAGPLFRRVHASGRVLKGRLSGEGVNEALKRWLDRVGIAAGDFGAHSLRAGMVTAAGDAGASPLVIMRRTGHKSVAMVERYFRSREAFAVDPLAGVL
jgi:integrase